MYARGVVCAFVFCVGLVNARINLQGTVANENGELLSETLLFLKSHPEVACSTDDTGAFVLKDNTYARFGHPVRENAGVQMRPLGNGSGFIVRLSGNEKISRIDSYNAIGRRLSSVHFPASVPAEHVVPISPLGSGAYFIKVSTDRVTKVFQTLPGLGISSFEMTTIPAAARKDEFGKRSSAFLDTLVIYSYEDYQTKVIGLTSYENTHMQIVMQMSNTWNNCSCAPLVKSGSMVKIIGTGYKGKNGQFDTTKECDFEMGQFCDTIWGKANGLHTSSNEQPVHTVVFTHNWLMDTLEISQGEYDSLMKKTYPGYTAPTKWSALYGKGKKYPVYGISWDDAALFCNARSKRDQFDTAYSYTSIAGTPGSQCTLVNVSYKLFNNGYRLPTEAEWEYCARAGIKSDFWWGKNWRDYRNLDTIEGVDGYATWAQNSWDLGQGTPGFGSHPVDSSEIGTGGNAHNWYELRGLCGNVSEWCNDRYAPYQWGTFTDPVGNPDWTSQNLQPHVVRGGNWGGTIDYLRSANRYFYSPAGIDKDVFIGFRTVRVIGNEL